MLWTPDPLTTTLPQPDPKALANPADRTSRHLCQWHSAQSVLCSISCNCFLATCGLGILHNDATCVLHKLWQLYPIHPDDGLGCLFRVGIVNKAILPAAPLVLGLVHLAGIVHDLRRMFRQKRGLRESMPTDTQHQQQHSMLQDDNRTMKGTV